MHWVKEVWTTDGIMFTAFSVEVRESKGIRYFRNVERFSRKYKCTFVSVKSVHSLNNCLSNKPSINNNILDTSIFLQLKHIRMDALHSHAPNNQMNQQNVRE